MRVSMFIALQPFVNAKAQELGISDAGEVVNYLLLQIMSGFPPNSATEIAEFERGPSNLNSSETGTASKAPVSQ